jgi:hypothetical protein
MKKKMKTALVKRNWLKAADINVKEACFHPTPEIAAGPDHVSAQPLSPGITTTLPCLTKKFGSLLFEPSPPNQEDALTVDGVLRVLGCDGGGRDAVLAVPGAAREVEAGGEEVLEGIVLTKPVMVLLLFETSRSDTAGAMAISRIDNTLVWMGSAARDDGGLICCAHHRKKSNQCA